MAQHAEWEKMTGSPHISIASKKVLSDTWEVSMTSPIGLTPA